MNDRNRLCLIWQLSTLSADMRQVAKTMRSDTHPKIVTHGKELMSAADNVKSWVDEIKKQHNDELASERDNKN